MRNSETASAAAIRIAPGSQLWQRAKRVGQEIGAGFGFVTGKAVVLPHLAAHRQAARLMLQVQLEVTLGHGELFVGLLGQFL